MPSKSKASAAEPVSMADIDTALLTMTVPNLLDLLWDTAHTEPHTFVDDEYSPRIICSKGSTRITAFVDAQRAISRAVILNHKGEEITIAEEITGRLHFVWDRKPMHFLSAEVN